MASFYAAVALLAKLRSLHGAAAVLLPDQLGVFSPWRQAGMGTAVVDIGFLFDGAGCYFAVHGGERSRSRRHLSERWHKPSTNPTPVLDGG